jgi:hypothetical protein
MKSNTARHGCQHFAQGFLHPPEIDHVKMWIFYPNEVTEINLQESSHIRYSGQKAASGFPQHC